MTSLPFVAYALAAFGVTIGMSFAAAVCYDVFLAEAGKTTISEWFMAASTHKQALVVLIALAWGFVWGGLIGHLFWRADGGNAVWLTIVLIVLAGMVLGGWFGHFYFGQ